jgi:hypothetical protein
VSDVIEASREALRYLLVVFGGNRWIRPIRRTVESPDGTRHEERYPVWRAESMIDVSAPEMTAGVRSLSPCPCDGAPMPAVANVEMRLYSHTLQCTDGRRDADGRRIRSYEIRVWAGQCPGCGTIHWREYVPGESSDAAQANGFAGQ